MRVFYFDFESRLLGMALLSVIGFLGALCRLDATVEGEPESMEIREAEVMNVWVRLLERAVAGDARIEALRLQIAGVVAKAKEGLVWPEPEVRLGWGEGDRELSSEAALRLRIPEGADRRLVRRLADVDVEWLESCIRSMEKTVELEIWENVMKAAAAKERLGLEERWLGRLEREQEKMERMGEDLLDRIRLEREEVDSRLRVLREREAFDAAEALLKGKGLRAEEIELLLAVIELRGLARIDLPDAGSLELQVLRNRIEMLSCKREEEYVVVAMEAKGRGWLPRASFVQLGWDEGRGDAGDDWQIKGGFRIDLFSERGLKRLEANRRESEAKSAVVGGRLLQDVRKGLARYRRAEEAEAYVWNVWSSMREELEEGIRVLESEIGSARDARKLWGEAYRMERQYLDVKWQRAQASLDLEYTIGSMMRSALVEYRN